MKRIVVTMLFALSAFALMSGCSSDSTPAPAPAPAPVSNTLTGTAATGAPIDGTVTVKDAKGIEKDITTGTYGSFTLDVEGMTAPFLLKIMPSNGTATLYSYASQNGLTVNLTPATNLAMFLASGADLDTMYTDWDGTAVTAAAVATAQGTVVGNLVTQITEAGLDPASFNFFTTRFTADGKGIDGVLDNITITVDSAAGTYEFDGNNDGVLDFFDESATPPDPAPAPDPDPTPVPDPVPGDAVSIVTITGATHALDGTYSTGCHGDGSGSTEEVLVISGNTWYYSNTGYTDGACSTGATESTATATLAASTDSAIIGWYDGSGSLAIAPVAADGITDITNSEAFTPLTVTITAVSGSFVGYITIGEVGPLFYVVDDTGTNAILYRDNSFDTGDLNAGIFDPYTQL